MLDKLEKKYGKYAIKNLIYYVLGAYVLGYILFFLSSKAPIYQYITLEPALVMKGQVWRLFTWVCTIPQDVSIWLIFMFLLYFFIGRTLESTLGAFRYNLYIFSGWFFMTLGAMIIYWISKAAGQPISINADTYYINLASFLAFALLFPDTRVYLFGLLPIKMKVIAWIDFGYLCLEMLSCIVCIFAVNSDFQDRLLSYGLADYYYLFSSDSKLIYISVLFSILISLLNFFIFFFVNRKHKWNNDKRKSAFQKQYAAGQRQNENRNQGAAFGVGAADNAEPEKPKKIYRPDNSNSLVHKCAICGRTSVDNPELVFRFCSRCSGEHEYCQDHLFTHEHVKD